MALPNIKFIKGQGGLNRPLPGEDFISGIVFYTGTLPSGFNSSNRVKALYQPADAIAAGILNDYSDATQATATYLITALGGASDSIKIAVKDIDDNGKNVDPSDNITIRQTVICDYKKTAGDTTIALLGASLAAAINVGTQTHGYSATFNTATLTIKAPKKFGIYLNSGNPLVVTPTGTIAGTVTQFTGGIASELAVYYYHISEFFRMQPQGVLYVGFFAIPGAYTFTEISTVQNFAQGKIRQIAVLRDSGSDYTQADLTAIDVACEALDPVHKPLSALYGANTVDSFADISTLPDLSTLSANKASSIIAMDGGGHGWFLWKTNGFSIPALGTVLGTVALSKVSECIGWVGGFNISNGVECETLAFSNGQLLSDSAISDSLLDSLNSRRHIFLRKFVGASGSYWNDSHCAISASNDYAQIENNRTIDKAIRNIYIALLPFINSPLQLEKDGTLQEATAAAFENAASQSLDQMVRDAELSDKSVTVNPAQDVLSTSKIIVVVELLINGVARQIEVPIGFTSKIS